MAGAGMTLFQSKSELVAETSCTLLVYNIPAITLRIVRDQTNRATRSLIFMRSTTAPGTHNLSDYIFVIEE